MITRTLILNDLHGPWHDQRAVDLTLDIAEDINVDRILINGDLLDAYNINSHGPKHPDIQATLEHELAWGNDFIADLRKRFKKQHLVFLFGNHEYRLDRFTMKHCPSYWNFIKLENMLELERHEVEWYDYNYAYRLEKTDLFIQHSPPSYSKNAAMVSLERKLDRSFIYGCTHRMQWASRTGYSGEVYHAVLNGWLGSTNLSAEHARIFSYAKGHESWQQCFSIVTCFEEKEFHIQLVPITNYRAVINGFIYEG